MQGIVDVNTWPKVCERFERNHAGQLSLKILVKT